MVSKWAREREFTCAWRELESIPFTLLNTLHWRNSTVMAIIPYVGKSINMHSLGTILTKLFIVNARSIAISEWHSLMYYSYIQHCISFCTVNALFIWTAVGNDSLQLRCFMIADGSFCCLSKSWSAEENIGPWGPVRDGSEWRRTYEICNRTPQKKWVMCVKLFLVLNV